MRGLAARSGGPGVSGYAFRFAGLDLVARGSGALFAPEPRALLVADLHLGKSERMARRGGALLPPFETEETLRRLAAEIAALDPARVILLGDSFDDDAAADALAPAHRDALARLAQDRDWLWLGGNHDAAQGAAQARLGPVALRHIAGEGPDISGHYHPKARLAGQSRPCFLLGADHLILPAFGAYTGGLSLAAPALRALAPSGLAILTGPRPLPVPIESCRPAL